MSCKLAALTTLSVCTLLTVLSLNQIQVCSAVALGEHCNETHDCVSGSNYTCAQNVCACADGFSNHSEICRNSFYGESCNSSVHCDAGLTCNDSLSKCICDVKTQFWFNECLPLTEIAVSNISASVEMNNITLNWNVTKQYSSNVTYTIKTDFGKSESVTSNGGIVIGLQSGSKYNFTVISTPPKDTFVNYSDYSVPSEPFWTYAVYGNVCDSEQSYPECVYGYDCRTPNNTAPKLCLCNTSQFWSSGCVDSERLAVSIRKDSVTRSIDTITLKWTANFTSNVTYTIKTSSGTVGSVNYQGGSISGLTPGNKYNFTVVSTPPNDTYTTYKAWEVQTGSFWTYAVYGNVCEAESLSPECAHYLNCTTSTPVPDKKLCLCNDTQFRSLNSLCLELDVIKVSGVNPTVTKDTITLTWTMNSTFPNGVTFQIQNGTEYIKATNNGVSISGSISGLNPGTNYSFNVISIPPQDNYTTYKNTSVTIKDIWTNALYGQNCTDNLVQPCDTNLTCRLNSLNAHKCLCNINQYWSSGCQAIVKIAVLIQNILVSTTTTNITLNWKLLQDYDGVTFFIQTDHGVNIPALSTGGSSGATISNLIPGSKYNFTILSVPPVDNYTTYNNASVAYDGIWTSAVYGNVCKAENLLPECVAGLTCGVSSLSNNLKALCLCNESQFWSSGCIQIDDIKVSNITYMVTSSSVVLNWKANALYPTVTFEIHDSSGTVNQSATSNGGSISRLSPGTKYSFTVVSVPPKDSYTTYSNALVKIENIWTSAIYGQICTENATQPCDTGLTCRINSIGALKCLCNSSQYWSASCQPLKEIAVSNITATVETNKITLNWNVIKQYSSNVTYTIKTDFGKSVSVTSNGGIVIGLQSGSKYNFTVVSTPPKDTFVNYTDYSVPSEPFWTYAVYGNVCESEQTYPVCISGYVCRPPNTTAPNLCLCETSQIWSSGCVDKMCNASKTTTPPTTTSTTRGTTTTTTTATTRGTTHASQHFTTDLPATATGQSGNVRHDFICHFTTVEIFIPVSEAPNAVLRLRDPSCVLVNNGTHHVITFPFNLCGTSVTSFKDYSIVTNYVTVHTDLHVSAPVVFGDDYSISLECQVPEHMVLDGSFQAVTKEPPQQVNANPQMGFHLREYTSADYTQEITKYPVQVSINKEIFLEVTLADETSRNTTLGVKVNECRATPSPDPHDSTSYLLIRDSCPATPAVHLQSSPSPETYRFSVQTFHFSGNTNTDDVVYIHCDVSICHDDKCGFRCGASGGARRKRRSGLSKRSALGST